MKAISLAYILGSTFRIIQHAQDAGKDQWEKFMGPREAQEPTI
jgi:hypothetical protein